MFILLTAVLLKNEFHRWSLFVRGRKIGSFHPDAEMLHLTIAINTWGFQFKILKLGNSISNLTLK